MHIEELWQKLLFEGFLPQQGHRGIIYVLRREAKVDPLYTIACAQFIQFVFKEILNSLHIMVRDTLGSLDAESIFFCKLLIDSPEFGGFKPGGQFDHFFFCKKQKILYLYPHPVANETVLRKIRSQRIELRSVAPVYRAYGSKCVEFHAAKI
jgi:hypothetical protein